MNILATIQSPEATSKIRGCLGLPSRALTMAPTA